MGPTHACAALPAERIDLQACWAEDLRGHAAALWPLRRCGNLPAAAVRVAAQPVLAAAVHRGRQLRQPSRQAAAVCGRLDDVAALPLVCAHARRTAGPQPGDDLLGQRHRGVGMRRPGARRLRALRPAAVEQPPLGVHAGAQDRHDGQGRQLHPAGGRGGPRPVRPGPPLPAHHGPRRQDGRARAARGAADQTAESAASGLSSPKAPPHAPARCLWRLSSLLRSWGAA